jgi:hypothetical protein
LDSWKIRAETGRLTDFRDTVAHTNEIQIAVNIASLPYFFNDAKYLLRHITFIKRETPIPVFSDYSFGLSVDNPKSESKQKETNARKTINNISEG